MMPPERLKEPDAYRTARTLVMKYGTACRDQMAATPEVQQEADREAAAAFGAVLDALKPLRDRDELAALVREVGEVLGEVLATLRREAPGTALNNHRFDALGAKARAVLAKAEAVK